MAARQVPRVWGIYVAKWRDRVRTVEQIILLHGGLAALKAEYIRIENKPFQRLVIESIGNGPRGLPMISVAHTYLQNGDVMYDPEMTFEVSSHGLLPISYQLDPMGIYQECIWREDDGSVKMLRKLVTHLMEFAEMWDANIRAQGFMEAYLRTRESLTLDKLTMKPALPVSIPAFPGRFLA
jgi:hypothetical protein